MGIFFCAYIFNQFLDLISNIDKKILSMLVSASFWFCSSRKIRSYFLDEVFLLQISSKLDYPSLLSMDGEQTHTYTNILMFQAFVFRYQGRILSVFKLYSLGPSSTREHSTSIHLSLCYLFISGIL